MAASVATDIVELCERPLVAPAMVQVHSVKVLRRGRVVLGAMLLWLAWSRSAIVDGSHPRDHPKCLPRNALCSRYRARFATSTPPPTAPCRSELWKPAAPRSGARARRGRCRL